MKRDELLIIIELDKDIIKTVKKITESFYVTELVRKGLAERSDFIAMMEEGFGKTSAGRDLITDSKVSLCNYLLEHCEFITPKLNHVFKYPDKAVQLVENSELNYSEKSDGFLIKTLKMNKEAYFKISEAIGLPKRCPILDRCERRAWSIYFLGYFDVPKNSASMVDFLISEGVLEKDFETNKIKIHGEPPSFMGRQGSALISFDDVCPEVNLFDKYHGIFFAKGIACIDGDWDSFRNEPKHRINECRHFSECPEFIKFQYEKNYHAVALTNGDDTDIEIFRIRKLIIENELESALQKALDFSTSRKIASQTKNCINLLRRFREIQSQQIKGLIPNEEMTRVKNGIADSLLDVLEILEKSLNNDSPLPSNPI